MRNTEHLLFYVNAELKYWVCLCCPHGNVYYKEIGLVITYLYVYKNLNKII